MIKNRNQLKIRLKEDKESLLFETIMNRQRPELVGIKRKVGKVQTNAFTLLTEKEGKIIDSWVYYNDNVKVENNMISYLDVDGTIFIKIRIIELENITKKEFQELHKDYKAVIDDIPYILKLENGGTVLAPVRIID